MNATLNKPLKSEFPRFGSPEAQLQFLLKYAVLAPSCRNSQPWLWEIDGNEILLYADRSRAMPALDPYGRELIMSCGAALQHLYLAIRAFGYAALEQVFPTKNNPDLLARVRLGSSRPPTSNDELLFRYITERHTHRGEFEERQLPNELLRELQDEAEQEGVTLYFAQSEEERTAITELIERGDLIQNRDFAKRREITDWMTPMGKGNDGIPTNALGFSDLSSHVAPLAQRVLNCGDAVAKRDKKQAHNAPVLVVLSTIGEGPHAWLAAGQALSRVLLRARAEGVWASFFSQTVQVDETWSQLRHMVGIYHFPQLVFRLGYAGQVPATPRRPVEEVARVLPPPDEFD